MLDSFASLVMLLNAAWTGLAFYQFTCDKHTTLRILVAKSARGRPTDGTTGEYVWACVRFLGAINLAISLFAGVLLVEPKGLFTDPNERIVLAAFFAAVHLSQFVGNLPIACSSRPLWPVLRGRMLPIFAMDAAMTAANVAVAAGISAGSYQTG